VDRSFQIATGREIGIIERRSHLEAAIHEGISFGSKVFYQPQNAKATELFVTELETPPFILIFI